ncbi:MAG: glycosyl transferase [Solirubrobacterales bacterium]|nr:glycosyl transferase [Solirubrobacterales bacterium]
MRVLLGAFGDPGHAFPMLSLGSALVARGHDVCFQTWRRWECDVVSSGMRFAPAPEYQVFPTRERPLKLYQAAVLAARETVPLFHDFAPDIAVIDILTPAPALAAELAGVPRASLVPHVHPHGEAGHPPYSIGARLPRTRAGARLWRSTDRLVLKGLEQGRREYNECRARLGLEALPYVHTGLSRDLTLVATLPQLEYPRHWPPWLRVIGPLLWEPPGEKVAPPPGPEPVVLIAPSTSQDPDHALLRAALAGLAREPVRVIATYNGRAPDPSAVVPANAVLVPWLSYAKTMPACDLVVLHGGHGTLARALVSGRPVVICPAAGDMAENAARADWAGVGVRLPRRLLTGRTLALAVRRALADGGLRSRAAEIARWAAANGGTTRAWDALEDWVGVTAFPRRRQLRGWDSNPQPSD